MLRRFAIVSSLVVLGSLGLSSVARAGEGAVAGSAAFTVTADKVTGVAVSAAVGKRDAVAHAFNYSGTGTGNTFGLQNSAFALGTSGQLSIGGIGDPSGSTYNTTMEDGVQILTTQGNSFNTGAGFEIKLGTTTGNVLANTLP
ncbi:hypothetical protein [Planktothrix mougeotii]|uniref:Uncharacterized protein n=1 Tax=Planktothrix mougeotii LEGE 06226 TaxID=1828728 RepID=A0ABR9UIC3_9CYAN|nr:hypothetical protein [Planktothrix mougeotii]MBE9146208.1 hypothetical protein [Planktothrix mougeotii LEGE 06226]